MLPIHDLITCDLTTIDPLLPSKPNQDRLIMFEDPDTETVIFACLDGHGTHGHRIAQFFSDHILGILLAHPLYTSDLRKALREVLVFIEQQCCTRNEVSKRLQLHLLDAI